MNAKGKLSASTLYFGDNGRMFCGDLKCAGASAHFSGRTINGQRVTKVTTVEVNALRAEGLDVKCDRCGKGAP